MYLIYDLYHFSSQSRIRTGEVTLPRWHPVPPSFAMPLPAEKCGGRDISAMSREMTLDKASEYNVLLIDTTLYNQSAKLAIFFE